MCSLSIPRECRLPRPSSFWSLTLNFHLCSGQRYVTCYDPFCAPIYSLASRNLLYLFTRWPLATYCTEPFIIRHSYIAALLAIKFEGSLLRKCILAIDVGPYTAQAEVTPRLEESRFRLSPPSSFRRHMCCAASCARDCGTLSVY